MVFCGQSGLTIDIKGRMMIPVRFREDLGNLFWITNGLDGCISVYPDDRWQELRNALTALPLTSTRARKFSRFILAGAESCEPDKAGRILLPQHLRDYAGLTKDVVMAGVGDHLEIWNADRWNTETTYDDIEELAENMEDLGI